MKTLLTFIVIIRAIYCLRFYTIEREKFIYFKCIIYLFVSSIHSIILGFPIPLGAMIMFFFSFFDNKNIKPKYRMIRSGLLIILLSISSFHSLTKPFQQAYLYLSTQSVNQIDFYSYNGSYEDFLFSIDDSTDIATWINELRSSTPSMDWNHKKLGTNLGYKLLLQTHDAQHEIYISPYDTQSSNLFLGDTLIPYQNNKIISLLHSIYSNQPSVLTINASKSASINIYNESILDYLWRSILWNNPVEHPPINVEFIVPSYLFFDNYLGCRLSFTTDFNYARIDTSKIIEIPPFLQIMLKEQYLLSQLQYVNELSEFEAVHTSNPQDASLHYSIDLDPSEAYYGLYLKDYKTNETVLLHSVESSEAAFYILKHPYILLLDEKSPGAYYLMLVNQNIPDKHRYIVKNEPIIPRSISLCPQNTQFSYIVNHGDVSTLYLVSDYYRSPKTIATGNVQDSLFLSNQYLAFTQIIDNQSVLSIYSLAHQQVVKYINIPGDIILTDASDNTITFVVQAIEGLNLKEGFFYIDNNLEIHQKSIID